METITKLEEALLVADERSGLELYKQMVGIYDNY